MKLKFHKKYDGSEHTEQEKAWNNFSEKDDNRKPAAQKKHEGILKPVKDIDWCFYWHDLRYEIAQYIQDPAQREQAIKIADAKLVQDLLIREAAGQKRGDVLKIQSL
jgi:hypothetical protein